MFIQRHRPLASALLLPFLLAASGDWSQVSAAFKKAMEGPREEALRTAVDDVVADDSARAARLLLQGVGTPNLRYYWALIDGLARLSSPEAIEPLSDRIVTRGLSTELRRDLLMALQLNKGAAAPAGLLRVLKSGTPDLQVLAADELVNRTVKDAAPAIIAALRGADGEVRRRLLKAIVCLTGIDVGPGATDWQAWWDREGEAWKKAEPPAPGAPGRPGMTVVETIRRGRKTEVEDLSKGGKEQIVVVDGVYDEIQKVLDTLKIPHTRIPLAQLAKADLSKTMALIINCGSVYTPDMKIDPKAKTVEGREAMSGAETARIRDFVANGGYLFTSDWGLCEVLQEAFPGYVKKASEIDDAVVPIYPRKGMAGHPFLREVFVKVEIDGGEGQTSTRTERKLDFTWQVDGSSYTIAYDPAKVTCLVEAPDLSDREHTAVAVTFSFGDDGKDRGMVATGTGSVLQDMTRVAGGKVLHILSHFHSQETQDDDFAIQNMLLNFVIEAKERKSLKKPVAKR